MITKLSGGLVIDPTQTSVGVVRDVFIQEDRIVADVPAGGRVDVEHRLDGKIVMAGGIDIHTHIGGGKVNVARLLLPQRRLASTRSRAEILDRRAEQIVAPLSCPVPSTLETGRRYLEMGYTACFEPAVLPANARQAHLEMADTPWLDTGGYLLLGNEELLLRWIAEGVPQNQINDYMAWMLTAHQCLAVKVVNAGGISAFKFNQRSLDIDECHAHYRVTPRKILQVLARAVDELKLPHPLHVHCGNLGMPGNIRTTLATIDAVEGRRIHLTHAQFHAYGNDGPYGFSSAARQLAELVNRNDRISIDVGQVIFGQTATLSGDTMHQFANRRNARPRKAVFQDLECQAGCGVLPFRYRQSQYVHSLQWAIGLELLLLIEDPWRIFLTTDHPNGGPFTSYPHLIRLLMDRDFRNAAFEELHVDSRQASCLNSLNREYSLEQIAILTRAAPARSLGLTQIGNLQPNSLADICVYSQNSNPEALFAKPAMVFRRGQMVLQDGQFLGSSPKTTYTIRPDFDRQIVDRLREHWPQYYGYHSTSVWISNDELADHIESQPEVVACGYTGRG